MTEAKHTPGPWKAHFEEAYYVTGPDLGRVAMMMNLKGAHGLGGRRTGEESAANCRLIAAAPAMYEALADCVEALDFLQNKMAVKVNPPTLDTARAALALARGEA